MRGGDQVLRRGPFGEPRHNNKKIVADLEGKA